MKIHLSGLTKNFGKVVAVDDLSVTFQSGKLIALLGPSGCGKSTLLYMLSGITPASSGQIYFDEKEVTSLAPEKREVGLVFQNYALYPHMTVLQNICFPLEIQKIPKADRLDRALAIAKLVHIEELMDRKPGELSGGQQQRVALSRSLVKNPKLLLLDEPLSNLDARLRIEMREEIRRIQMETGVTTIFVTHDQEEAMSISDEILLLKLGKYQQYDSPQKLYDDPVNQFVAEFLGNPPINKLTGTIQNDFFELDGGTERLDLHGLLEKDFVNEPNKELTLANGTRVVLAIRSESFLYSPNATKNSLKAIVTEIYQMGKEELTHLRLGSQEIRAYIAVENHLEVGQEIFISFKQKGVFLFNEQTGKRYL